MSKKKTAKRAFISSLLVLAMCFTMLAGTTFAWFTDSVSANNIIIKSGKLDMEIEYYDTTAGSWKTLDGNVKLFDDNALFEPGFVQVAQVRIANVGDLNFKYKMAANIVAETAGINKAGDSFNLSDYLKFAVVPGTSTDAIAFADRDAAIAAADAAGAVALSQFAIPAGQGADPILAPGAKTNALALIIYMPTTVGNEANYGTTQPSITLGLKALAAQATVEEDSFDETYDEAATYLDLPAATIAPVDPTTVGTAGTIHTYNTNVDVPADAAYDFSTPDDAQSVQNAEYKDWNTDFVLTFNKDVEADKVYLFGNYGTYGWLGDNLAQAGFTGTIPAGTPIKVLADWLIPALGGQAGAVTYAEVVDINNFKCAIAYEGAQTGLIANLKLVMEDGNGAVNVISEINQTVA